MAGSRIEKLGTVFSRVQGLLRSGAMKEADKPIWYEVYATFPPKIEPKFDRFIQERQPPNILYREDALRAKFYNNFGSPDVIDMKQSNSVCYSEKFIKRYAELESKAGDQSETQLFEVVKESFKAEGIVLKTLDEIEEEKKALRKSKESQFKMPDRKEASEKLAILQLEEMAESREANDFIYDEILDPELKQK